MSWSLAKRGLELFDSDLPEYSNTDKKTKGNRKSLELGTHRQGVRRAANQKRQSQLRDREAKNQLIQKQVVNVLDQYKNNARVDHTVDNIRLLKKIDKKRTPTEYIDQVTNHHLKELEKKVVDHDLVQRQKGNKKHGAGESSVFSDEDFEKMNEEWLRLY
ncbi:uncharacterized protein LOC121878904 isoform X2 [Homarus americanus]|uniref:Putative Active regulator of SIRT1- or 40S ribosomal protein S19-binding 1-containing protein n=1 Tax=Homarus americanus TaxID=6706 RepID=A0A8J5JHS7_HOMAM|nr:uncharacterized protein LOC121878904 isoform X2 [Homarus americanus]KAG7158352.1 putative Active regulator of SIRT1- or 40S ribosomal protein S19-binding 1-containing protein [Homarus americanus]